MATTVSGNNVNFTVAQVIGVTAYGIQRTALTSNSTDTIPFMASDFLLGTCDHWV
jgi:hypothetical protein